MLKLIVILLAVAGLGFAIPEEECPQHLERANRTLALKPFRWAHFAKQWRNSAELLLYTSDAKSDGRRALLPAYQQAVKVGDARIPMLEELGFNFREIADGFVGVPQLGTVVGRFRAKLKAAIQAGKIPSTSALDAGVLVRTRTGERIALPFGEERDDVFLVDVSGRPADFTFLISHNIFPISSNERAIHELFHLRGLISDLDYMAGIHYLANQFMRSGGPLPLRDKYVRFFFAYEGFAYLAPDKRAALEPLLVVPPNEWPSLGRASQVYKRAAKELEGKIIRDARALETFCTAHVTFLGGAGEIGVSYADVEIADSIPILLRNLRRDLINYEMAKSAGNLTERVASLRRVAMHRGRLEAAVLYSTEFDLKTWFQDLALPKPAPESALYRFVVESGVGTTGFPLPDGRTRGLLLLSLLGELDETYEPHFGNQFKRAK